MNEWINDRFGSRKEMIEDIVNFLVGVTIIGLLAYHFIFGKYLTLLK